MLPRVEARVFPGCAARPQACNISNSRRSSARSRSSAEDMGRQQKPGAKSADGEEEVEEEGKAAEA